MSDVKHLTIERVDGTMVTGSAVLDRDGAELTVEFVADFKNVQFGIPIPPSSTQPGGPPSSIKIKGEFVGVVIGPMEI